MNLSVVRGIKWSDTIALSQIAVFIGPSLLGLFGVGLPMPFGLHPVLLIASILVLLALIYLRPAARADLSLHRLGGMMLLVVLLGILLGWILEVRSDAFYTKESFYQVSALLLVASVTAEWMERRVSDGTPSEVLAESTNSTAAFSLALFWVLFALDVHYLGAIMLLLGCILVAFTLLLRLPGVIVPIYRSRRRAWLRRSALGSTGTERG